MTSRQRLRSSEACRPPLRAGRGIPAGHPFDRVLENLGSFGNRFTPDMRAGALLFRSGDRRLAAVGIPLRPSASITHTHEYSNDTSMPAYCFMVVSP